MKSTRTASFGELVATVFDYAEHYSSDQHEVARLAAMTVMHVIKQQQESAQLQMRLQSFEEYPVMKNQAMGS